MLPYEKDTYKLFMKPGNFGTISSSGNNSNATKFTEDNFGSKQFELVSVVSSPCFTLSGLNSRDVLCKTSI